MSASRAAKLNLSGVKISSKFGTEDGAEKVLIAGKFIRAAVHARQRSRRVEALFAQEFACGAS
jgi:hypothetical protein